MPIEAESHFVNRREKRGQKSYDRYFIYVPSELAHDSGFPFKEGERVKIKVTDKGLSIRKC